MSRIDGGGLFHVVGQATENALELSRTWNVVLNGWAQDGACAPAMFWYWSNQVWDIYTPVQCLMPVTTERTMMQFVCDTLFNRQPVLYTLSITHVWSRGPRLMATNALLHSWLDAAEVMWRTVNGRTQHYNSLYPGQYERWNEALANITFDRAKQMTCSRLGWKKNRSTRSRWWRNVCRVQGHVHSRQT